MSIAEAAPSHLPPTERSRVRRLPKRGSHDLARINAILDEGLVAHVGFSVGGQPFVIPTAYARIGDTVMIHGSVISRMLQTLAQGVELCLTVTLLDGLVLARSGFHHSMNYRSVAAFGRAKLVEDAAAKEAALAAFTDRLVPGRWASLRPTTEKELKITTVLSLPLLEASAKVREGGPIDDDEDMALPIWAGVLPLAIAPGPVVPDPLAPSAQPVPSAVAHWAATASRR
ncbi:pyridoxamine 5'-phosphate oxidase family protein [Zavarzinia sp. CC-PAN008]|uniref:pyridoxamine 5'-phosphate oxidase family protein n=1 Tax=Zavarzinia sp. CC-PAN008 TaxID=3243332 RepID=UPI003F743B54